MAATTQLGVKCAIGLLRSTGVTVNDKQEIRIQIPVGDRVDDEEVLERNGEALKRIAEALERIAAAAERAMESHLKRD